MNDYAGRDISIGDIVGHANLSKYRGGMKVGIVIGFSEKRLGLRIFIIDSNQVLFEKD